MLLSYATVDFYFFYDGTADMQIWALLRRKQCRVSDTQVTIKALAQERFVPSLVEIGPVILKKQTKMWRVNDNHSGELNSVIKYYEFCIISMFYFINA